MTDQDRAPLSEGEPSELELSREPDIWSPAQVARLVAAYRRLREERQATTFSYHDSVVAVLEALDIMGARPYSPRDALLKDAVPAIQGLRAEVEALRGDLAAANERLAVEAEWQRRVRAAWGAWAAADRLSTDEDEAEYQLDALLRWHDTNTARADQPGRATP